LLSHRIGGAAQKLLERATEIIALAAAIWVFVYKLPRARREQDAFAIICSLLTGLPPSRCGCSWVSA